MGNDCRATAKGNQRQSALCKYELETQPGGQITGQLKVVVGTWLLQKCQLFDQYDQQNTAVKIFNLSNAARICKIFNQDPVAMHLPLTSSIEQKVLMEFDLTFQKCQQGYIIKNNIDYGGHPWLKIGSDWEEILVGEIFKAGMTSFQLKKIITDEQYLNNQHKSSMQLQSIIEIGHSDMQCRICLDCQYSKNNPLISPCKCQGSVKYVHIRCLKEWLFASEFKTADYISIDLKKSQCEICKASILNSQVYRDIIATILSGKTSFQTPFAIFQGVHTDHSQTQLRNYFVYSFKKINKFKIGRGKVADVRAQYDKTISRENTQIKYKNGHILIRDCGSKFGTIKKIRLPFFLPLQKKITRIQIGSNSLSLLFKRDTGHNS